MRDRGCGKLELRSGPDSTRLIGTDRRRWPAYQKTDDGVLIANLYFLLHYKKTTCLATDGSSILNLKIFFSYLLSVD